jgi:hypothetical protein
MKWLLSAASSHVSNGETEVKLRPETKQWALYLPCCLSVAILFTHFPKCWRNKSARDEAPGLKTSWKSEKKRQGKTPIECSVLVQGCG